VTDAAEEVANGIRCAVCEETFESLTSVVLLPATGEYCHKECWGD
jgi:hypothetical protein